MQKDLEEKIQREIDEKVDIQYIKRCIDINVSIEKCVNTNTDTVQFPTRGSIALSRFLKTIKSKTKVNSKQNDASSKAHNLTHKVNQVNHLYIAGVCAMASVVGYVAEENVIETLCLCAVVALVGAAIIYGIKKFNKKGEEENPPGSRFGISKCCNFRAQRSDNCNASMECDL